MLVFLGFPEQTDVGYKATRHIWEGNMRQIEVWIEYASTYFTLEAGDLIVTGTPAGVGPLKHGDEVVVELSSGPRLVNMVA